jgi:hypothetical protein
MFESSDLIHSYSRAQAIGDGTLVDVSETAKEVGITYPTALTRGVYERDVRVPEGIFGQDEAGRLWDILWMMRYAIRRGPEGDTLLFTVFVRNDNREPQPIKLKGICGPDDDGSPCITVLLPEEN